MHYVIVSLTICPHALRPHRRWFTLGPRCQHDGCRRIATLRRTQSGELLQYCPYHLGYVALTLQHYTLDMKSRGGGEAS